VKKQISFIILAILLIQNLHSQDTQLWYQQPADEWMKALPVGNGRLGAMIYGRINTEIIALNEITLWSGQYDAEQNSTCGKERIADIRRLFFDGDPINGNGACTDCFARKSSSPGTHLPLGDLKLKFNHYERKATDYSRTLDLENAVASVSYNYNNVNYRREYFCSNPDQALIIHLTADQSASIGFELSFNLLRQAEITATDNGLSFSGQATFPNLGPGGVNFTGKIQLIATNGDVSVDTRCDNSTVLLVNRADEVTLIFDLRTDYKSPDYQTLCATTLANARNKSYEQLKQAHIADYARLFNRMELALGNAEANRLPTDARLTQVKQGQSDPALEALFFQYGRYLLIASSRENSPLPANLQGVWNDNLACNMGWTCDYHLDINTEQNYWAANITNLAECNAPWFDYIESLSVAGEKTAQSVYGSPGWVVHTVSNAWDYTGVGDGLAWGMFPASTAWISSHLWTHYTYTQDVDFLRNKAYPILKKAAVFFLDYMTENPKNGYLMAGPCNSPENTFKYNGWELAMSMMTTADRVLIHELFSACIQASGILDADAEFRAELETALTKFPPIRAGADGTVREWFDDYEDAHPNHRHLTHLLSLYPFAQITPGKTPELAEAAAKTIESKLNSQGWEDVEFCRAWIVALYARLKDADKAHQSLEILLGKLSRENLFTMSPAGIAGAPYDIFIFDGNEAGTAAIAEMLLQTQEGYIELLPALPETWNKGRVKGLCLPGGAEIAMEWENGAITAAELKATANNTFRLKHPDTGLPVTVSLTKNETWKIK
jgi:alpha-L-fucosidase 2